MHLEVRLMPYDSVCDGVLFLGRFFVVPVGSMLHFRLKRLIRLRFTLKPCLDDN